MPTSDPRPLLMRSFAQATTVAHGVSPDQLALPTPCSQFDVSALLRHLAGVGQRIVGIAQGKAQTGALPLPEGVDAGQIVATFDATHDQARVAWADDDILERKIELPFGTFTGATVAEIYTLELTTHTWDLATATGQTGVLDDELAEASLTIAHGVLPPNPRGEPVPFEPVVLVAGDAPMYDRLAGFLGRSVA